MCVCSLVTGYHPTAEPGNSLLISILGFLSLFPPGFGYFGKGTSISSFALPKQTGEFRDGVEQVCLS